MFFAGARVKTNGFSLVEITLTANTITIALKFHEYKKIQRINKKCHLSLLRIQSNQNEMGFFLFLRRNTCHRFTEKKIIAMHISNDNSHVIMNQ